MFCVVAMRLLWCSGLVVRRLPMFWVVARRLLGYLGWLVDCLCHMSIICVRSIPWMNQKSNTEAISVN